MELRIVFYECGDARGLECICLEARQGVIVGVLGLGDLTLHAYMRFGRVIAIKKESGMPANDAWQAKCAHQNHGSRSHYSKAR